MRRSLIALSLLAAGVLAAKADDALVWKSPLPTGYVTNGEQCFATVRMVQGKRYYNPMECNSPNIHNYVSMSWPMDGPVVNMKGIREAHHVRIDRASGHIILY